MNTQLKDSEEPKEITPVEESVGTFLLRALFDEVANLRQPWIMTPQQQQDEILDRLRLQIAGAVNIAVKRIAAAGFIYIAANIESLAIKDEAKAVLTLARGTQEIHDLADRVGTRAMLVFADAQEYTNGMHTIKSQLDQPPLPLD